MSQYSKATLDQREIDYALSMYLETSDKEYLTPEVRDYIWRRFGIEDDTIDSIFMLLRPEIEDMKKKEKEMLQEVEKREAKVKKALQKKIEAEKNLEACIRIDPDDTYTHEQMAQILHIAEQDLADKNHKLQSAIDQLQQQGRFDFLTHKMIAKDMPNQHWEAVQKDVFTATFAPQWRSLMQNDRDKMIATEMDLYSYCFSRRLVPISVDYVMPDHPYEFSRFMTNMQNQLFTTVDLDQWDAANSGGVIKTAPHTMISLKEKIVRATVLKKANPSEDRLAEYHELLAQHQGLLVEQIKENPTQEAEDQCLQRLDELEEKLQRSGAREREAVERQVTRTIEKLKRLQFIAKEKDNESLDHQLRIDQLHDSLWSEGEKLIRRIGSEESAAIVPQVPLSAIGANYSFAQWQEEEAGMKTVFAFDKNGKDLQGNMMGSTHFMGELNTVLNGMKEAIQEHEGKIQVHRSNLSRAQQRVNQLAQYEGLRSVIGRVNKSDAPKGWREDLASAREEVAREKMEIRHHQSRIDAKRDTIMSIEEQQKREKLAQLDIMENAKRCAAEAAAMKASISGTKANFFKMIEQGGNMVPTWETDTSNPPDGSFMNYYHGEKLHNTAVEESESSDIAKSSQSSRGRFWFMMTSKSNSQEEKQAKGKLDQKESEHCWAVSFQAMQAHVDNECWDLIKQALGSAGWYIDGVEPGSFWRSDKMNCRFYVKEAIFVQKFAFYCSDTTATSRFYSGLSESGTADNTVFAWNATVDSDGKGKAQYSTSQSLKMGISADKKTVHRGNISLKFLLLEPIIPGPIRGGQEQLKGKAETDLMKKEYVEQWTKTHTTTPYTLMALEEFYKSQSQSFA